MGIEKAIQHLQCTCDQIETICKMEFVLEFGANWKVNLSRLDDSIIFISQLPRAIYKMPIAWLKNTNDPIKRRFGS